MGTRSAGHYCALVAAIVSYKKALGLGPIHADAYLQYGECSMQDNGDLVAAIDSYTRRGS